MSELDDWLEYNRQHLLADMARVQSLFARAHGAPPANDPAPTIARREGAPTALETLCVDFELSPFERDVLVLCAGAALDSAFAASLATLPSAQHGAPTFGMALAALPDTHWSALLPSAPLRHWRLIELDPGLSLTESALRIDERVLHHIVGMDYLDERLRGLVRPATDAGSLAASQAALAERIAALLQAAPQTPVLLCGSNSIERQALAARACANIQARLYVARAADLPATPVERAAFASVWEREALLTGLVLLVDCDDDGSAADLVADVRTPLILSSQTPQRTTKRALIRIDVARLQADEQRSLWHRALGSAATHLNGQVDQLVAQFGLGAPEIAAACQVASAGGDSAIEISELWDICRAQSRPQLDDLAQRITPVAAWADLVLPPNQLDTLREIAIHVRHRMTVYDTWGFATKSARGLGLSVLFAGASGTGKTMAAEVLANELRLDLYHIDLSAVVSKYIGETEKNLRRVFDAAESGGAILLFDEADALFGKRSDVKDSHDRYANIEVSYLLQSMEAYRGLAILTTNIKSAIDPAFMRRIRFAVDFPFPDAAQRAEIWRRIFPAATPTSRLDAGKLARLNVAGGHIRNIALHAAFRAAASSEPVGMAHLLRAAQSEYAKLEKPLTEAEIGGWV